MKPIELRPGDECRDPGTGELRYAVLSINRQRTFVHAEVRFADGAKGWRTWSQLGEDTPALVRPA